MAETFQRGETPRLKGIIIDVSGNAVDPTTTTINLIDSTETAKLTDAATSSDETGEQYYDYTIPSDGATGQWRYNMVATGSGGRITIKRSIFNVEVAI